MNSNSKGNESNMNFVTLNILLVISSLSISLGMPLNPSERKTWIRLRLKRGVSGERCKDGSDCLASSSTRERREADPTAAPTCLRERAERLAGTSRDFVPSCRTDGSYAPVQCHPSTKSCWCVTETGRPIPGSAVLSKGPSSRNKPNCTKYHRTAKSATKRRSSQAKKNRNTCNHADRTQFNAALIKSFRSEFNRVKAFSALPYTYRDMDPNMDDVVLSWKFDHLDRNRDFILARSETKAMKRVVKQHIQPRQCAKNFIKFCSKGDREISKTEWLECLSISLIENLSFDTFKSLLDSGQSPSSSSSSSSTRGINPFLQLRPVSSPSPPERGGNRGNSGAESSESRLPIKSSSSSDPSEVSNCRTDRQSALDSQKAGLNSSMVIIPECTPNGLYQKTQCAQGRTYCWCVYEDTGLQIPNSVVVNASPGCERNVLSKQMKGCIGGKRQKFMIDLMDTLRRNMSIALHRGANAFIGERWNLTTDEEVAKWHFYRLDTSSSGMLERREWKVFRNETSYDKRLRRCGKSLPRHCDVNQDRRITLTEWLECFGVKTHTRAIVRTSSGPRQGKNPFTAILS